MTGGSDTATETQREKAFGLGDNSLHDFARRWDVMDQGASVPGDDGGNIEADIRRMGSGLTGNLPQPRAFDNPLRGAKRRGDPSEQIVPARVAIGVRIWPNLLSSRRTSPVSLAERVTHGHPTPLT